MKYVSYLVLALALSACGQPSRKQQTPEALVVQALPSEAAPDDADDTVSEPLPEASDPAPLQEQLAASTRQPVMAETLPAVSEGVKVGGVVEFDKTLHDFGDISQEDGPQECSFRITNISDQPIVIYEVVSSCGCTDVQWTREPLQPGKSGTISASYKNEDGPMPFDKTLTVYVTGLKKPVILRLRGVVHEKKVALSELYGAQKLGAFGLKSRRFFAGTLLQGEAAAEEALVANLGRTPLQVGFTGTDPRLSLSVSPNPIPAGKTAVLRFSVCSDKNLWGRNDYRATPVLNGSPADTPLVFSAVTQENFAAWTASERENAARPRFDNSTFTFGMVAAGTPVEAVFSFINEGKSPLQFHSIDAELPCVRGALPAPTPAGEKGSVRLSLDTSSLEKGENVIMVTFTTNSPFRPVVNVFLVGIIS